MTSPPAQDMADTTAWWRRGRERAAFGLRRRELAAALGIVALGWAAWASYRSLSMLHGSDVPIDWVGLAYAWTGLTLVIVGLVAARREPFNRAGRLMTLCGLLLLLPSLTVLRTPMLWTLGATLSSAYQPVLFYLVLAFPDGRLRGRARRAVMAAVIVHAIAWGLVIAPLSLPEDFGCIGCPASTNLLYLAGHEQLTLTLIDALARWGFVVWGSLVALVIWRLAVATPPGRRVLAPVYALTVIWGGAHLVQASTLFLDWIPFDTVQLAGLAALSLLPFGFALGLLRARARRWRVGDLAVQLQRRGEPQLLQTATAHALGDPTVEVGYWSPEDRCYLTADRRLVELPDEGSHRAATVLEDEGQPIAVLIHDAAINYDTQLIEGVGAVARLAVVNERLAAAVQTQLAEVRASRARIVAASDAERKRVERNLHDGAQQRLVTLSLQLRLLAQRLDGDVELRQMVGEALEELGIALGELRELAQGVHPSVLTDHGLAAALEYLAERAALPVDVDAPGERFAPSLESTAYFITAEALTNVAKYAHASSASVLVARENGSLTIEISDDGAGGADPRNGTGLRGLADRVAALDGHLHIDSPAGRGTRITAKLPCD